MVKKKKVSAKKVSEKKVENKIKRFAKKMDNNDCCSSKSSSCCCGSGIYGLGFIGALIYFIKTAATFWMGFVGFFKAIVWPAYVVYYLLKFLGI